jgi:hypothetical protein
LQYLRNSILGAPATATGRGDRAGLTQGTEEHGRDNQAGAGRYHLSTLPGQPSWYVNLVAHPDFTFHVKHGAQADLPAVAIPVTDEATRRHVFEYIVDDMNQPHNPARIRQPTRVDDWMKGSPLVEVVFP